MKKFLTVVLAFLLFALCFSGCGIYQPPIITDDIYGEDTGKPGDSTKPDDPENPDDEEKLVFTVTLYSEGRRFSPNVIFYAQWTSEDRTEIIEAPFNALGVAQTEGLDGEYRVTLSGLPDDYTYDPNGHNVDNENRDVIIDLLPIIPTTNGGTDYYRDCITIKQPGTYRHTFNARNERAWFRYEPSAQGKYVIESWVDVNENEVNPIMEHYFGTSSYVNIDYPDGTYDDGGSSSTYTKNFRFELQLNQGMVGNVWIFQLHADCKGEYPITIDFTIKLIGDYEGTDEVNIPVEATGPFIKLNPAGSWVYNYRDNGRVLDSKRFKLNWVDVNNNGVFDREYTDLNGNGVFDEGDEWKDTNGDGVYTPGVDQWRDTNGNGVFDMGDPWVDKNGNGICDYDLGDGYYHLYDEEKYAENDGWGPILFAKLNKDIEAMNFGDAADGGSGGHFANPLVRLKFGGKDYTKFMETYFSYCNNEGAHPVTPELKEFLQNYATTNKLFSDGESLAETYHKLEAAEEDMWLFACGYYL